MSDLHVSKDWNADRTESWWRLQRGGPWDNVNVERAELVMLKDVSFVCYEGLLADRIDRNSGLPYLFAVGERVPVIPNGSGLAWDARRKLVLGVGFRPTWDEARRARFFLDSREGELCERARYFLGDEEGNGWAWL